MERNKFKLTVATAGFIVIGLLIIIAHCSEDIGTFGWHMWVFWLYILEIFIACAMGVHSTTIKIQEKEKQYG